MNVSEALRRINFKIGTLDDITGRAINNIIETRYIVDELNTQLMQYANKTKGIRDTFSTQLNIKNPVIQAPSMALRSESYLFAEVIVNNRIFPLDIRGINETLNNFTMNPFTGITSWLMPWSQGKTQFLGAFPMSSTSASSTTLTANISNTDTTIPVTSTANFISNFGRATIGTEKILYQSKDDTNFYGCIRGYENTTAQNHNSGDTITHCNLIIYYARLPYKIIVTDDNIVSQETLAHEIEITEEHLEGILKLVAYNLILKLDNTRAAQYKIDADTLFEQYEADIRKGYSKIRNGSNAKNPYFSQSGYPVYTNLES